MPISSGMGNSPSKSIDELMGENFYSTNDLWLNPLFYPPNRGDPQVTNDDDRG